ncbi:MAG: efflux RND transporter periplasmic adaptor subunit [Phycisphaerae bacterium]
MKRVFAVVLMGAVLGGGAVCGQTTDTAGDSGMDTGIATTEGGKLVITGHMAPAADVKVPAGQHALLAEVDVKEGQAVKKGQQLAKLDDAIQQATVDLAKHAAETTVLVRYAQNQLDSARNQWEKVKNNQGFSPEEKRQKELDVKQAELGLEKEKEEQVENQIKLKQEENRLDHMTIRSPIDGYVLRVNKQAGEETDDEPLIEVVDTSKLYAIFDMPRQEFGKVHVGDSETVKAEGKTLPAKVISVDPVIDLASGLFRVKMEVDNAGSRIPAGVDVTWVAR